GQIKEAAGSNKKQQQAKQAISCTVGSEEARPKPSQWQSGPQPAALADQNPSQRAASSQWRGDMKSQPDIIMQQPDGTAVWGTCQELPGQEFPCRDALQQRGYPTRTQFRTRTGALFDASPPASNPRCSLYRREISSRELRWRCPWRSCASCTWATSSPAARRATCTVATLPQALWCQPVSDEEWRFLHPAAGVPEKD
uniref:FGE-sulfatase domain-containing protein n=1 Tax=Macrostomum lignano TaxID=282301 RepID=A0A1I8FEB2_9PLAT